MLKNAMRGSWSIFYKGLAARFASGSLRWIGWLPRLTALLVVSGALVAYAQTGGSYDLTWWTVDGGGSGGGIGTTKQVSGGQYELLSTVGQPDAHAKISGGAYTLHSGFWPGEQVLTGTIYLPIVMKKPAPDLIGSFTLTPNKTNFSAGESALITVVITNVGTVAAGSFWVDFYINPSKVPAVNEPWNEICASICKGIAWFVSGGLGSNQSVTLTSNNFPTEYSIWDGSFPAGTSDLYIYVDSWNRPEPSGGVSESNESNNLATIGGLTVSGFGVTTNSDSPPDLPPRPAP